MQCITRIFTFEAYILEIQSSYECQESSRISYFLNIHRGHLLLMFIENSTSIPIPANSVCVRTVSSGENPFKFQEHLQTTGCFFEQLFVIVQSLSRVRLFATPWTAARQASLSFTISQSLLKLKSVESMMPSNHLILCNFLLLLPLVFPKHQGLFQ